MFDIEWFKFCLVLFLYAIGAVFIAGGLLYKIKYGLIGIVMWILSKIIGTIL